MTLLPGVPVFLRQEGQTSCLSISWKVTEDMFRMRQTQILLYDDLRHYFYETNTDFMYGSRI